MFVGNSISHITSSFEFKANLTKEWAIALQDLGVYRTWTFAIYSILVLIYEIIQKNLTSTARPIINYIKTSGESDSITKGNSMGHLNPK